MTYNGFKYPKLLLFLCTLVIAYYLFKERDVVILHNFLSSLGYVGFLLAGILYAYGFTAAIATAVLLSISGYGNLFLGAVVSGLGALFGDLIIFYLMHYSLADEVKKISKARIVRFIGKGEKVLFGSYKNYALASFAGFLIASPFPTEAGVALMATVKSMSLRKFVFVAYILHTVGIFVILSIGRSLA
ncbi:hypothetical protein HY486_00980 [Candidatus Woesearchaeota archaeon]|nr:hypothetical protein [Candidatus Woesearchaeota archaeon]